MARHFVYIVECKDSTLYTGYTTKPKRRVDLHNQGKAARYTKGRTPINLVYIEEYKDRSTAQKREYEIKLMTRKDKLQLIKSSKEENERLAFDDREKGKVIPVRNTSR